MKGLHIVSFLYTYGISMDIPTRGQIIVFISLFDDYTFIWLCLSFIIQSRKVLFVLVTCYTEVENQLIK